MVIKNEVAFSWILFAVSTGHGVWSFFWCVGQEKIRVWDEEKIKKDSNTQQQSFLQRPDRYTFLGFDILFDT
jgi:hypothetical protein